MLSLVTGTLNRRSLLPGLLENTIFANESLELVLVDGGSQDGTLEFLKSVNHPRLKLVEVGKRTSCPHFVNLGIRSASHEYICQWNDDVLLVNDWNEVLEEIKNPNFDSWIFSWQYLPINEMKNKQLQDSMTWNLCNTKDSDLNGEIVLNYGIFKKDLFRKFGMFDSNFHFYYSDGELAHRYYELGVKFKNCHNIRVASISGVPKSSPHPPQSQWDYYVLCRQHHIKKQFQSHLEFLT
jgi:glycosyltransferase involved in cell wall biosynthesis